MLFLRRSMAMARNIGGKYDSQMTGLWRRNQCFIESHELEYQASSLVFGLVLGLVFDL